MFVEYLHGVLKFVNILLIHGMPLSMLVIIVAKVFKTQTDVIRKATNIIRWILISYTIFNIVLFSVGIFIGWYSGAEYYQISINRASGPYWWAYWAMFFTGMIIPLALLLTKVTRNIYFVLAVAILMNMGWMLEWLVVVTSSMYRDYIPSSWTSYISIWNFAPGIIVGILILSISLLISRIRTKKQLQIS